MFRALQYIIILGTMGMIGFYMYVYQPELVDKMIIAADVFGISKSAQAEHERIEKIHQLSIPYEEKQVLMNHTVFMNASPEMVKLALGEPKKEVQQIAQDQRVKVFYVYYLAEDKRPTILVFQDDKLTEAYKGSALDVQK